jgi:TPR repeat protein
MINRLAISLLIASFSATAQPTQTRPLRERLLESAQKGDADAQFELGKNYETGIGLPKDLAQAQHWYHAAADQGDPYALASLGILYNFGKGVQKDYVQAFMYYELAVARSKGGNRDSIVELRDDLGKDMNASQIAEARRLAKNWKPTR